MLHLVIKKGMRANEKLREKLDEFSDNKINNEKKYRLIVAINLGVLNDFIKNYKDEFAILNQYVDGQALFDNIPAWKIIKMENKCTDKRAFYIGHIDFTSFHRYEIREEGLDISFFSELLNKIVKEDNNNIIFKAYKEGCSNCEYSSNCPVFWNYKELVENDNLRSHIVRTLSKAVIKGNLSPSVREVNDFYYEIIIGRAFNEKFIMSRSINRLNHFIENMTLWLLYESTEGLLAYTAKEDILADKTRKCDKQIISLNLKTDFKKWLKEDAFKVSSVYVQIYNDILYCEEINAKKYKDNEQEIKQAVYKLYIRSTNLLECCEDGRYRSFLKYLFYYNIGAEDKCKEVIKLVEECVYLWNGRLVDKSGSNIKNGVIVNRTASKFYLFKRMDIKFAKNNQIEQIDKNIEFSNFSSTIRFSFKLKDGNNTISLDIDYELYEFLLEVKSGFVPTNSDRKRNVKFDTFARKIIAESNSDIYVYSRGEDGKTYRISKDDFDNYTFDYEV